MGFLLGSEFNFDFQASFTKSRIATGEVSSITTVGRRPPLSELSGLERFSLKMLAVRIFQQRTPIYARGDEGALTSTYFYLDLTAERKKRDGERQFERLGNFAITIGTAMMVTSILMAVIAMAPRRRNAASGEGYPVPVPGCAMRRPALGANRPDPIAYGRGVAPGLSLNLLVHSVVASAEFQAEVFEAEIRYWEEHFAIMQAVGSTWLLHSDWSYRGHAFLQLDRGS